MKIRESLVQAAACLSQRSVPDPHIEAEALIRHVTGIDRTGLFSAWNAHLTPRQEEQVSRLTSRRLEGEPLAYLLGHREFYGLDFLVNPHVLVPRQETELLVDKVLGFAKDRPGEGLRIADVGTGSGAIAVSISRHLPNAQVYATDISPEALSVADINRRRHGVLGRVHLRRGDLLQALDGPVDVVVSNPPYLKSGEILCLAPEVQREPFHALDGGATGLEVIGRLLKQAPEYLRPGGLMAVEIDPEQLDQTRRLAREAIPGASVSFDRDLLGMPRVVCIETKNEGSGLSQRPR